MLFVVCSNILGLVVNDNLDLDDLPSGTNIDDLPDDSQQEKTWRCTQTDKAIAVEVKDVQGWKEIIEEEGWQCAQELSVIPDSDRKFTCEPAEIIGILTVIWLQGKGGKQQMQTWMNKLAQSKGMVCQASQTTEYWE